MYHFVVMLYSDVCHVFNFVFSLCLRILFIFSFVFILRFHSFVFGFPRFFCRCFFAFGLMLLLQFICYSVLFCCAILNVLSVLARHCLSQVFFVYFVLLL